MLAGFIFAQSKSVALSQAGHPDELAAAATDALVASKQ
jgi:hypothetical protein